MGFQEAVKSFFTRYTDFNGRSSRSEYWWAYLGIMLIFFVIGLVSGLLGETVGSAVIGIAYLAILIPSIAIAVRRLHDVDKSGWFLLIALIPLIGGLILLYFYVQKGTDGPNRFGPDPLGSETNVFN